MERIRNLPTRREGRQPAGDEARAERITGSGRVGCGNLRRRDVEAQRLGGRPARQYPRAARSALDHGDRCVLQNPVAGVAPEKGLDLGLGREQDVRGNRRDELSGGTATLRKQRPDRRQVERDLRTRGCAGCRHRSPCGGPDGLAHQRVGGNVHQVQAGEPLVLEVVRPHGERRSSIRHERSLAIGRHQDADPTRALAGNSSRPNTDAVRFQLGHEASTRPISSDGAHQLDVHAEAGEPARGVRGGAPLSDPDRAGHIGAGLDGSRRCQHDVEDEVAEHENARLRFSGHVGMVSGRSLRW